MPDSPVAATPQLQVNGHPLELVSRGRGRPLLFLHPEIGLSPTAPVIDQLAQRFSVIAPSHPGFGHTPLLQVTSTVDDLAYLYLDLLDQFDLRDTVVVGVTLGAWIAAEMATKSRERIGAVVLANPVGIKTGDREHRDLVDIFSLAEVDLHARTYHDPKFGQVDFKSMTEDEAFVTIRNRESAVLYGWSPYMHNPKLAGRLHRIKAPTLVLWGTSDRIAPESYGRSYASRIPGARFQAIDKAGRYPHIERPEVFAQEIIQFAKP